MDQPPRRSVGNSHHLAGETRRDPGDADRESLYFFPDQVVSEAEVRWQLEHGSSEEKAWVISHLLRFAQWDDIWTYVSRDQVREIFPELELPENLRAAWARMLKVEAVVG